MRFSTRVKRIVTLALVGAGAYVLLFYLGDGSKAWETLISGVKQQLLLLLSAGLAGTSALLIPSTPKQDPGRPPQAPVAADPSSPTDKHHVPLPENDRVRFELVQWRNYDILAKAHIRAQEAARAQLDAKQTILRTAIYGVIGLGFLLCLFGFWAPSITSQPIAPVTEKIFFLHLSYLLSAFVSLGVILGIVVFRVRVYTPHLTRSGVRLSLRPSYRLGPCWYRCHTYFSLA